MRLGVISNLRSHQNKRRGMDAFRALLAERREIPAVELDGVSGMEGALRDFASRSIDLLVINGGDGTVIAALTHIFNDQMFERLPRLLVLPGGMTNMIGMDVGYRGTAAKGLKRLLTRMDRGMPLGRERQRALISMRLREGDAPYYGMFMGTASIYRAIIYTRESVHPMKLEADAAAGVTLALFMLRRLFGGGGEDRIVRGDRIKACFDDGEVDDGLHLLSVITTLDRLLIGSRPFWGKGERGPIHYTRIASPAPRLLLNATRILFGFPGRPRNAAYLSRSAKEIALHMTAPFTLDGELFEPVPGQPVRLRCDHTAQFLDL